MFDASLFKQVHGCLMCDHRLPKSALEISNRSIMRVLVQLKKAVASLRRFS